MNWLQANVAVVLSVVVVSWLGYALFRALRIALQRRAAPTESEDLERAEEIKQEIRRTIAERKTNPLPPKPIAANESGSSRDRSRRLRPIDPFGGPNRRWWIRARDWVRGRRA